MRKRKFSKWIGSSSVKKKYYFQALAVLGLYWLIEKGVLLYSLKLQQRSIAYIVTIVSSVVFGIVFVFLFNHDTFFGFVREVEKIEKKSEKKIHRYLKHLNKSGLVIVTGIIGGPVFSSFVASSLMKRNSSRYKYFIVALSCMASSWMWFFLGTNTISIF